MKEHFFSLPGCARDADPSLLVGWAGWNALERSRAVAAWLIARKEQDGWPAARLLPLLAALRELLPWVRQRHDAPDPDYGVGMGDYFAEFLDEEARALGLSDAAIRGWAPPAPRRCGGRRKAAPCSLRVRLEPPAPGAAAVGARPNLPCGGEKD